VGWQPNDRLGRIYRQLFEHGRQILRGCTEPDTHTNTDGDTYSDSYGNSDTHGNVEAYAVPKASAYSGAAGGVRKCHRSVSRSLRCSVRPRS
jgi:hypothetical protein